MKKTDDSFLLRDYWSVEKDFFSFVGDSIQFQYYNPMDSGVRALSPLVVLTHENPHIPTMDHGIRPISIKIFGTHSIIKKPNVK